MRPPVRNHLVPDSLLQFRTGRAPGPSGVVEGRGGDVGPRARSPRGAGFEGRLFAGLGAYASGGGGGGSGATTQAAAKEYKLPDAETNWTSHLARFPHASSLPLWLMDDKKEKAPKYNQVFQQGVANCYLAATLAALANTPSGVTHIQKMIAPHVGSITTICKKYDSGKAEPEQKIKSDRWFTVSFKKSSVDVSNVLYHDDSDRDPNLRYLTTPKTDRALWGAIIEVAYASLKGGYDNISAGTGAQSLKQFFDEFSTLTWNIVAPAKDGEIKKACVAAHTRAALIATSTSAKTLTPWHGYAVLGMSGTKVKLWNPLGVEPEEIGFKEMLAEIQAVAFVR